MNFREDVLEALTDLKAEILALQNAVREERPVSKQRLLMLQKDARSGRDRIHDKYAQEIRMAHIVL